jgi:hypothetical protein
MSVNVAELSQAGGFVAEACKAREVRVMGRERVRLASRKRRKRRRRIVVCAEVSGGCRGVIFVDLRIGSIVIAFYLCSNNVLMRDRADCVVNKGVSKVLLGCGTQTFSIVVLEWSDDS